MQRLPLFQIILLIAASCPVFAATGCSVRRPEAGAGFASATPTERLEATRETATAHDWESIPDLIMGLESDDAAVRFMSANTLNRLTGKRLGYRHDATPRQRSASAARWVIAWEHGDLVPIDGADTSKVHFDIPGDLKP